MRKQPEFVKPELETEKKTHTAAAARSLELEGAIKVSLQP